MNCSFYYLLILSLCLVPIFAITIKDSSSEFDDEPNETPIEENYQSDLIMNLGQQPTCTCPCAPNEYCNAGTCAKCSTNCLRCFSGTFCYLCELGYTLIAGACVKCPEHCTTCTTSDFCTVCDAGYYWDGSQCLLGPVANCQIYNAPNGQPNCVKCSLGYILDLTSNPRVCVATCITGLYCTMSKFAISCSNCNPATSIVVPNSQCRAIPPGCKTVVIGNSDGGLEEIACTECEVGYMFDVNNNCIACPAGCDTCKCNPSTGEQICTKCSPGFEFDSNKVCQACPAGCDTCHFTSSGKTTCETCLPGFKKTAGQCLPCAGSFVGCTDSNNCKCRACMPGYCLVDGQCELYYGDCPNNVCNHSSQSSQSKHCGQNSQCNQSDKSKQNPLKKLKSKYVK